MKRQDKELRMRHFGATVVVMILITMVGTTFANMKPSAYDPSRVAMEEAAMVKAISKQNDIAEKAYMMKLRNAYISRQNTLKEMGENIENKKYQVYLKGLEERQEKERIRIKEERERNARIASMVYQGEKGEYQKYAYSFFDSYGWSVNDLQCLINLWERESHWNPSAHNSSSGAHGIAQSLPASKMASEGDDYYTNPYTQIRWGIKYIASRYGSPSNAWAHSQSYGWY